MKLIKLIVITMMVFSINSHTQELNQDFMDSLPDDIRKDLETNNQDQGLKTKENYRPYLYSSKLRQAEELLSLKDRLEKDLLELERRLSLDNGLHFNKDFKVFGSDFFNTFQTSFMPINEPNPNSDYTLDIGDILQIQLIGTNNYIDSFPISGDGSISLPEIGKIVVAGLSLNEASLLIKSKVNSAFFGNEAFINLTEIRDVNILVSGNAKNPGIYTLTGNSNLLHAIFVAGGIDEYGSYREIDLIRDNVIIETLDVYDLLIEGKFNLNKRLRSGDVVFVKARKNIVTIDGAVNRPGKYEVFDEQNLDDLILYANGIKNTADLKNISLERILDGTIKSIPIVNNIQFTSIKSLDGDSIYIREHPYRIAKISGAVQKPGSYVMASGETVDDLIKKAGDYTDNAYPFGAIYMTESAKLIDQKSKEVLYQEFLDNILALSQQNMGSDFDLNPIIAMTKEIKDIPPNGRVLIDISDVSLLDLYNIHEGDELHIPEITNVVYVYGETSTEGAVMYSQNQELEYYVNKSGGYKKFADTKSIYILHPNGESQLYSSKRNIFESSPKSEIKIYPGSIIFVPKELDKSTPRRLAAQAYVSILGNLGIALASLSSINNN